MYILYSTFRQRCQIFEPAKIIRPGQPPLGWSRSSLSAIAKHANPASAFPTPPIIETAGIKNLIRLFGRHEYFRQTDNFLFLNATIIDTYCFIPLKTFIFYPMNNKNQNFAGIFEGFAEKAETANSINVFLSLLPKLPKGIFIRQYEIFHKKDIAEVINSKIEEYSSFHKIFSSSSFFGFEFNYNEKGSVYRGFFAILQGNYHYISRIITISYADFWNMVVRRLVKRFYPDAMPIFFRQNEIEQALFNLEKGLGIRYRIRISDVIAKEERNQNTNFRSRKYDTQRWWTDLPISEVFSQAKERGQWFSGIRFVIQRRIGDSDNFISQASGRLYKFGELNYNSFYPEINSFLLSHLESQAYKRLSTLDGRGMRDRNYQPVSPIEIAFDYDIFSENEEVRRFMQVVSDYPNSTKLVFHSNPYYHSSIADFVDGSSFEVWVLSSNKVVLLPQAKSTVQAFERFIGYISSNFGEGVVNEYQE